MKPKVGELWRSTATLPLGPLRRIPAGTVLVIVERQRGMVGGESRVIWEGGTGWISDHCVMWERVDAAG
jgi:hypothetical protein